MSQSPAPNSNSRGRGTAPSRGGRGRGGRSRGKAARARGSTRGMRIPPEYLAEVIARREGRDPASISTEDAEEDEDDGEWTKYAPRALVQQDAEEEDTGITVVEDEDLEAAEEERQAELETQRVLALHREKATTQNDEVKGRKDMGKQNVVDEADVDHALGASLRAMALRDRGKGGAQEMTESKVIQIEWDAELESLQRDKAEAEARTALKQRFKNPGVRGHGTGGSLGVRKPATVPDSAKPDIEVLEDFLDDLLR